MFKKIKDTLVYIFAGIGTILGAIFLLNVSKRKKHVEIDREEAGNNREVELLKKQLKDIKTDRSHLEAEVNKLKETLDGRTKKVKDAKKAVKAVDDQIADLEAKLGIK